MVRAKISHILELHIRKPEYNMKKPIFNHDTKALKTHPGWYCVHTPGSGATDPYLTKEEATLRFARRAHCTHKKSTDAINSTNIFLVHGETQKTAITATPDKANCGEFKGKKWKVVPWDPNNYFDLTTHTE